MKFIQERNIASHRLRLMRCIITAIRTYHLFILFQIQRMVMPFDVYFVQMLLVELAMSIIGSLRCMILRCYFIFKGMSI